VSLLVTAWSQGQNPTDFVKPLALLLMLIGAGALFSGCQDDNQQGDDLSKQDLLDASLKVPMERIYIKLPDSADYRRDFEVAIAKGDIRFVGVMGYALEVPGVPDYDDIYSESNGVKVIEGSSDSYPDSASLAQTVFFESYATGYNTLLLRHLNVEAE